MKTVSAMVLAAVMAVCAFTCNAGTITWGYGADLGAGYSAGWLVQLYKDVSNNGWGPGSTIGGDDQLVAGDSTTLASGKSGVNWLSSFASPAGVLALGDHVYTVIYNAPTIFAATQYYIVDTSTFALPSSDIDAAYTLTGAVPEPGTMVLLGLGLVTVAARSIRAKKQ
jgi:hypothetical protein